MNSGKGGCVDTEFDSNSIVLHSSVHTTTVCTDGENQPLQTLPFEIGNVRLKEACWLNGQPWFTGRAIAEWMGYSSKIIEDAVAHICERNPHILTFSTPATLAGVEGARTVTRQVIVFNIFGLCQIVACSGLHNTKTLNIQASALLAAAASGKLRHPTKSIIDRSSAISLFKVLEADRYAPGNGTTMRDIAEKIGKTQGHTYALRKQYVETGTLTPKWSDGQKKRRCVFYPGWLKIVTYIKEGHSKTEAMEHFGTSLSRIRRAIKEIQPQLKAPHRKKVAK